MATTNYGGNSINELASYTDAIRITHEDLTTAGPAQTITKDVKAGEQIRSVAFKVNTAFNGGATSALALDVGDGDDPDGYVDGEEIHADASEVLFGPALDGLLTGKTYAVDDTIDIKFTATGGNVSLLDAGDIEIYFNIVNINEISSGFGV